MIKIQHILDIDIDNDIDKKIRQLLTNCFPHEQKFTYQRFNNEMPINRWLLWINDEIIGHLATHEKSFYVGHIKYTFCGIAEVCVRADYRKKGFTGWLLDAAENYHDKFDYSILLGNPEIYKRYGYQTVSNVYFLKSGKWEKHHSYTMVKCLASHSWIENTVYLNCPSF